VRDGNRLGRGRAGKDFEGTFGTPWRYSPLSEGIMPKIVVHTVNARDTAMLSIVRDLGRLSPQRMLDEIQEMLTRTVAILASKDIPYSDLKNALTPQPDRREVALVFDTRNMIDSWYGLPIHRRVLPLLHRKSSRSILAGDYIGENHDPYLLYKLLADRLIPARDIVYRHSSQFHIVVINNLTDAMIRTLHEGLQDFTPYAGLVDITYSSPFKSYISAILANCYIQNRNTIIGPHEDDRPDYADVNLLGFPFEEFGYSLRSVSTHLQGVLLTYKIERPVMRGFDEVDVEFSLNSVNPNPLPLEHFEIEIDEGKFDYIERERAESLRKIGIAPGNPAALKAMIREKIASNYIYSMAYTDEHDTTQFNIILEGLPPGMKPFRVLVGLKYLADARRLQLVTLF
jgi:hypothetical protein